MLFGHSMQGIYNDDNYDPADILSIRDVAICQIFDKHCVRSAGKGHGRDECNFYTFTITSTLCHAIKPRTDNQLSEEQIGLLKDELGLSVQSKVHIEIDISWQHKAVNELKIYKMMN